MSLIVLNYIPHYYIVYCVQTVLKICKCSNTVNHNPHPLTQTNTHKNT